MWAFMAPRPPLGVHGSSSQAAAVRVCVLPAVQHAIGNGLERTITFVEQPHWGVRVLQRSSFVSSIHPTCGSLMWTLILALTTLRVRLPEDLHVNC